MTIQSQLSALDTRVSRLELKGRPKVDFLRLLLYLFGEFCQGCHQDVA